MQMMQILTQTLQQGCFFLAYIDHAILVFCIHWFFVFIDYAAHEAAAPASGELLYVCR